MLLSILAVGSALIAGQQDPKAKPAPTKEDKPKEGAAKKHRGKFTISKETTYVTGPLDKDGYIDYAAALNERLGKGVTAENNANVLIWKAIGPDGGGKKMSAEFFRLMGMEPPAEEGKYFLNLFRYLRRELDIDLCDGMAEVDEQFNRAMERPWKAKEYPKIASWLEFNEKPLGLAVQASKRPLCFSPAVPSKNERGSSGLLSCVFPPEASQCRAMAGALAARAMLKVGNGANERAWQDLLACHRLGRLMGSGRSMIGGLVGIAIEGVACRGELAFLACSKPNIERIKSCMRELRELPCARTLIEYFDLGERFVFLDMIMVADRQGVESLEIVMPLLDVTIPAGQTKGSDPLASIWEFLEIATRDRSKDPKLLEEHILENVDWDPAFKNGNHLCDRIADALREKNRSSRHEKLLEIASDLKTLENSMKDSRNAAKLLSKAGNKRGKILGDMMICLFVPRVHKVHNAWDRVQQVDDNVQLSFALEWYHRDHGRYPQKLEELARKYLKQIPGDIFSGKPLIYRPDEKGYLLYSVGYNGKDDGGRGYDDEPPGDDLSVRMPLPELKPK
jgi:hypothetical protein